MMMQAPEMQEGANNAKNEERDAAAARMVALRAKVAAKQLEEKQAAAKAREAARVEELRAKQEAKRKEEAAKSQQEEAAKKAAEAARSEEQLEAKRAARLKELEIKEEVEGDLTASEYAEMLAIFEKQWQPPQTPQPAKHHVGGKGRKTDGAEHSELEKPLNPLQGFGDVQGLAGTCTSAMKGGQKTGGVGHTEPDHPVNSLQGKGLAQSLSGKSASATKGGHAQQAPRFHDHNAGKGKGQTKSKWSQNAVAMKTALDQQAHSAQGKAAVDIWDMEICNFQDITRAQYRPAGRRAWAVVGIMDGTSGRKEFSGSREGWRVTCKLRDESGITLGVVAFTEQIFWIEEQAALFHDQIVRMGPLKRKENSYTGQMDLHLCYTTKIVSTNELPKHIASFPELCGSWPAQAQWEQEKHARLKAEVVNTGDGDIELMVDGDISPTRFQVYGLHPALVDAVAGAKLLVEVFPMVGGGEKISEHSVVRLASS